MWTCWRRNTRNESFCLICQWGFNPLLSPDEVLVRWLKYPVILIHCKWLFHLADAFNNRLAKAQMICLWLASLVRLCYPHQNNIHKFTALLKYNISIICTCLLNLVNIVLTLIGDESQVSFIFSCFLSLLLIKPLVFKSPCFDNWSVQCFLSVIFSYNHPSNHPNF